MDPEANRSEQIAIAKGIVAMWDADDGETAMRPNQVEALKHDAYRLAELVLALNEWRMKGGAV